MHDLTFIQKAAIGAVGGVVLALLKLIEARFYLDSLGSIQAQAAYLTYLCYVLLGSAAAVFLADHELPRHKVTRGSFVLGLLAPSVLLAIANQPFNEKQQAEPDAEIPALTWLPISAAIAQDITVRAHEIAASTVEVLNREALEPTLGNAFSAALGRADLIEPYALVVGSTADKAKALDTAGKIADFLGVEDGSPAALRPTVVRVAGEQTYFVLVGRLEASGTLSKAKGDATLAAIKALATPVEGSDLTPEQRKSLAALLANAPVVPARALSSRER